MPHVKRGVSALRFARARASSMGLEREFDLYYASLRTGVSCALAVEVMWWDMELLPRSVVLEKWSHDVDWCKFINDLC